jgi:ankyrin repeat protein
MDIKDAEGKAAWEYILNIPELLSPFRANAEEKLLTKYKINSSPNSSPDWGKLLRMAVVNNNEADVHYCIEVLKINVNEVDGNPQSKKSALHWAVIKNHSSISSYLISHGANTNLLDAHHKTPAQYANDSESSEQLRGTLPNPQSNFLQIFGANCRF